MECLLKACPCEEDQCVKAFFSPFSPSSASLQPNPIFFPFELFLNSYLFLSSDLDCYWSDMASMSSESWENIVLDDAPEIDGALLMDLLEESHVEDAENERLGCTVIQSLEEEIGNSNQVESYCGNYEDCMDYGPENMQLEGDDYLRLASHIDDPFDWVDMNMVPNSHCGDIGSWYLETCSDEIGMVESGDARDYYYGDVSLEHAYSPLWQEK